MTDAECSKSLIAKYGQQVPTPLIVATVRAAWATTGSHAEATARADVAALADAVGRSSAAPRVA